MVAPEENRNRNRNRHFRHKGFAESAMEAEASWSGPLRLFRYSEDYGQQRSQRFLSYHQMPTFQNCLRPV
jgi:hypothetical protein